MSNFDNLLIILIRIVDAKTTWQKTKLITSIPSFIYYLVSTIMDCVGFVKGNNYLTVLISKLTTLSESDLKILEENVKHETKKRFPKDVSTYCECDCSNYYKQ
jgi:hypothetical protein